VGGMRALAECIWQSQFSCLTAHTREREGLEKCRVTKTPARSVSRQ
jgi:hypothetical protein